MARTASRKISSNLWAFFGILFSLFLFYPELFLVKAAPLTGDHLEQHFPWAFILSSSLKHFKLPFWLPLIHSGFPIIAESQIAAFYLPNLVLYFFLPLRVAYSYMNLVHWLIAGWGTYLYAKKIKLSPVAAFLAAFIFIFGSAYGGGYYNMTSLKTLCWFPVALYFFERYFQKGKWPNLLGLALVVSQSLVAGYLQMAVFTWFMFGIYVLLRGFFYSEQKQTKSKKITVLIAIALSFLTALILAGPQIYLTFQLSIRSNRLGLGEAYSYVGSASPFVLGTLFNPYLWPLVKGNLYNGFFSLFLILIALNAHLERENKIFSLWVLMTLIAFLLALGQWSPLYVALIKITRFYSFRIPAKFLGFCGFGFAILSAIGFEILRQEKLNREIIKKAFRALSLIIISFGIAAAFLKIFLTIGKETALKLGDFFVRYFVCGKPGHPHSLEEYHKAVEGYPDQILGFLSWHSNGNVEMILALILCFILLLFFIKSKKMTGRLLAAGFIFLALDLYLASYIGMKPNFAFYEEALKPSSILETLKMEQKNGKLGRVFNFRLEAEAPPFIPGRYMLEGIESMGVYSPLVVRRYFESYGLLGNVNDSNYQEFPTLDFVLTRLPLLGFINVSHIVSTMPIKHKDLRLLNEDSKGYLYEFTGRHGATFFINKLETFDAWDDLRKKLISSQFDPMETLLLEKNELKKIPVFNDVQGKAASTVKFLTREPDHEEWELETNGAGFFLVSETFFPGWSVKVNEISKPILKADGLFRAVRIDQAGRYKIVFRYKPFTD